MTIHVDKEYLPETEEDELTTRRQTKLPEKTKEVSLLFSMMNVYANFPGTDRIVSELGLKNHFVNIFHSSNNKTYSDSFFPSLLVHCQRRTRKQSKKIQKLAKRSGTFWSISLRLLDQLCS